LTKKFEEIRRGTLADLAAHYAEQGAPKGEIVVIVGAPALADAAAAYDETAIDRMITAALTEKDLRIKDAAAYVAAETGLRKNDVYQRALLVKNKLADDDGED
jgi:16S rRNA (cytidine1402-2'-O)-methyltransferase